MALLGCAPGTPVRPLLPRTSPPPPDVDALLAPLQPPYAAPLEGRVQAALTALRARDAEAARWLPTDWSAPHPRFVWQDGMARNLEPVLALCDGLRDEAVAGVPCAALVEGVERAAARQAALAAVPAPIDDESRAALRAALVATGLRKAMDPKEKLRPEVIDGLLPGPRRATSPAAVATWAARRDERDAALAEVELLAFRVVLAYGWQVRGQYAADHWRQISERRAWIKARDRSRKAEAPDPAWPASAQEAGPLAMAGLFRQLNHRPAADVIAALRPQGDQYARLIQAHARYRQVAEAGGFVAVPTLDAVRPGKRHSGVPALRARLAQEGFDAPPADPRHPDVLDAPLQTALMLFQQVHLVRTPRPRLGPETRKLLAIPAELKRDRVASALEAWRAALPRPDVYVQVNIPDYHVELWKDGKRLDRIRVVVGSGKRKWEDGKATRPNATPTFHAEIQHVVYRPYWNIPQRILDEEVLDADAREMTPEEQISWLEAKGYEVVKPGSKWQYVRQLPGAENPLGQVKILFPNEHDVYLHDTPAKSLFRQPVRAYSHGCMRVQEPLRLARSILELDGQYDDAQVQRWLREDEQETITLRKPIDIYIEYVPLRVDEAGRVWFLPDVYDRGTTAAQTAQATGK
ncbi:MAG: L,D-transpeptidase family protein [Myxococcales bacterium]|nr:L,D-transpeptidase family protein [Myxococcales bacterium]